MDLFRKDKKKKKKSNASEMQIEGSNLSSNVESHHEQRIADLKEGNKALQQAMEASRMTISLQETKIADLEKKKSVQVPKLLRVKLLVIGKTLKELNELWEDAFSLVADHEEASATGSSEQTQDKKIGFLPSDTYFFQDNERNWKKKEKLQKKKEKKRKSASHAVPTNSDEEGKRPVVKPKKKKKKKSNNSPLLVSSTVSSPQPSTSSINAPALDERTPAVLHKNLSNRSKSSSAKNRSKSSSKKRKVPESVTGEIPHPTENGAGISTVSSGSEVRAKKAKKAAKVKCRAPGSFKIRPLRPRVKMIKISNNRSVERRTAAISAFANLSMDIKSEPVDETDSLTTETSCSSSDVSNISMTETSRIPSFRSQSIERLMKRMTPKVLVTDILKNSGRNFDPLVHKFKERLTNGSAQIGQRGNDSFTQLNLDVCGMNGDIGESYRDSEAHVFNVSDSSDVNVMIEELFCIGDADADYPACDDQSLIEEL